MNILLVSPWFPWPPFGGALIRVLETLRYLARTNRVTLLAPVGADVDPAHLAKVRELCAAVVAVPVSEATHAVLGRLAQGLVRGMPLIQGLHYDASFAQHVRQLTAENDYQVVHIEHSFMAPYVGYIAARCQATRVLSMHNIESLRFRRELQFARGVRRAALLVDHQLFGSWEEQAVKMFDGIVAVSALEQEWIQRHAPAVAVELIPNGVDVDYFSEAERCSSRGSAVFTGLMNYPPNIDACAWFCDAVLPHVARNHADVRFTIVGDKPTATVRGLTRTAGVRVTGRVNDVRPYLAESSVVVIPLRSGGGTRLKILEAMAMGRPVVSTPQGAEGLDVVDGENILIAETPEEFAARVIAVLDSDDLARRLGTAGRHLAVSKYGWSRCLRRLDDLYAAAMAARGGDVAVLEQAV